MPGIFIELKNGSTAEYTKDPMTLADLEDNAVLVVATNTKGWHGGGSARFGHDRLGLPWGFAEGLAPNKKTYALPTLNWSSGRWTFDQKEPKPLSEIIGKEETSAIFKRFFEVVESRPDLKFYMTKVGCGIAGRSIDEMNRHFWEFYAGQPNVIYPVEFELPQDVIENW